MNADFQQNYLAQLAQSQNYMMAQNYIRQGQNMQNGYQMSGYGQQQNPNGNNGQYRRWLFWWESLWQFDCDGVLKYYLK